MGARAPNADWPSTRETLVARLREQSSGPEWDLFVNLYGPLIYRFCRRRAVQDADARDVTQNVFLAVRRGIRTFEYDPARGKFRSWLGTLTAREILRSHRVAQRLGESLEDAAEPVSPAADSEWVAEFNAHLYHTALERVRPEFEDLTWQAFLELWQHDRKPLEVAEQFGKPVDWVYQLKFRVLRRLKKEVRFLAEDIAYFPHEPGP